MDVDLCWSDKVVSTQARVVKLYQFSLSSAIFVVAKLILYEEVHCIILLPFLNI